MLFGLNSVCNVCWLFLWHYDYITYSLVLMLAHLATLLLIYLRLGIGKTLVSLKEMTFVQLPFSV